MADSKVVDTTSGIPDSVGPYTVYTAGGLFSQDELATNVFIKEAVWRLSGGKFQLILPQFRELGELDSYNVEAYIRNDDMLQVLESDIFLGRFEGLELDSGTVFEFALAKFLGKPAVILRTDFRRQSCTGLSEPYNLMVMNWPRTIEIHLRSYMVWAGLLTEERQTLGDNASSQDTMNAELRIAQKSMDQIATQVIDAMEAVLEMESPYPPEYQEIVYQAARISPGSGFDQILTDCRLDQTIQRLRINGSL